jgi:2-polyprenyl-3-methyl-5-hydroxy-6-metoxy-1,4-benzoquinol methylase
MNQNLIALYRKYYGNSPSKIVPSRWLDYVADLAKSIKAQSVLDFGCGPSQGLMPLTTRLDLTVQSYDPAVPGLDEMPQPADLVCCIHMLEHVDPADIPEVVAQLKHLTKKELFVVVSLEESTKLLPDGSPWHRSVFDARYWQNNWFYNASQVATFKGADKEYAALWRAGVDTTHSLRR